MNPQTTTPCDCTNCPGAGCTFGCQSQAANAACHCGPNCGCVRTENGCQCG